MEFLKYKPGLVGGHGIGVDPYYLAHKAESLGYNPQGILSGRRVNESIGAIIASKPIKLMIKKGISVNGARVQILGITFKENCPDIRNTRVVGIRKELIEFGCVVDIFDPWANNREVEEEFGFSLLGNLETQQLVNYQGIILTVMHDEFTTFPIRTSSKQLIYDVKARFERSITESRL